MTAGALQIGLLMLGVLIAAPASAADTPVYFLAIGSSRYLEPAAETDHGFEDLPGARNGALALADYLQTGGARFGITLTSPEGTIIGKADIDQAVDAVLARIARDRSAGSTPILLVYIAAHGISEGFGWNQFSIPGDFTYSGAPEGLKIDELAEMTIHAGALSDRLDKAKLHYLVLIDTCYEGTASQFDSPVLSQTAQDNIGGVAEALRFLNEFHQEDPVVFSTAPGTTVPIAPDPTNPQNNSMGPLARRLILYLSAQKIRHEPATVASFLTTLTAVPGDLATRPAITHAKSASWWSLPIVRPGVIAGEIEDRDGTATIPVLCCKPARAADAVLASQIAMRGTITLRSTSGESLLNGMSLTLRSGIMLTGSDANLLTLSAPHPDGDWSFEFAAPRGLGPGRFASATRYPFQGDKRNGLAISGRGTACNELRGSFEIAARPSGGRGPLSLSFSQHCEGDTAPLLGQIELETVDPGLSSTP